MRSKANNPIYIKGMRQAIALCGIFLLAIPGISQDQIANLEKYWRYRERLREQFMAESETVDEMGVNVPLASIEFESYRFNANGEGIGHNLARTGDGNAVIGTYLGVLATELWILKNNEQDYSQSLKELFYLFCAIERLDAYSESYVRAAVEYDMFSTWDYNFWNISQHYELGDINGYLLRNDASQHFFETNINKFHENVENLQSTFVNAAEYWLQGMSADIVANVLEGISLVNALVDTEDISNIPFNFNHSIIPDYLKLCGIMNSTETEIDFNLWADDITRRYIDFIQNDSIKALTHWYIEDPVLNELVPQGGGEDWSINAYTHDGYIGAAAKITHDPQETLQEYPGILPEGFYEEAFENINLSKNITKILRDLGTIDDPRPNTLEILRDHRENATAVVDVNATPKVYAPVPYEHHPLEFITLYRYQYPRDSFYIVGSNEYNMEIDDYNDLLNRAEECGVCSYLEHDWSTGSRYTDIEKAGTSSHLDHQYPGLDYMLLHNLRYIAFHWPDFDDVIAEPNYAYEYVTLTGGDIYSASNIYSATVEFKASRRVVLEPGFRVEGGSFKAHIGSITNGYDVTKFVEMPAILCDLDPITTAKSLINTEFNNDLFNNISVEEETSSQIPIYPNPATDILYINLPVKLNSNDVAYISIYNSNGVKVFENKCSLDNNVMTIDISGLSYGIYFILFDQIELSNRYIFIKQ